jgi:23S rRNA (adenine2503-C2)-methyltransferase
MEKTALSGLTLVELQQVVQGEGLPKFTAKQMAQWLYAKQIFSFDEMTNLSKAARERLDSRFLVGRSRPVKTQVSADATEKYLFRTLGGDYVETVYIPTDDRATLCISCQVGCKMGCRFCVTGQQGFHGNLVSAAILNQIFSIPEFEQLTNIVYMGMGEPMDNLDNILASIDVLTSDWGLAWSPRRITVSSVGIIPGLKRFLEESQCHVAVSLHNAFANEREAIMPAQRAYPIADVVALLRRYDWNGQRRISFEYTLFKGLNDDIRHATQLVSLLKGLRCRVNLIPFHPSPDTPFQTSSTIATNRFRDYINAHGITCTVRTSRGQDIMAACGLLAGQTQT